MPPRTNGQNACYIGVVMACGFITLCSLPDAIPFLVRLTMMVALPFAVGRALRWGYGGDDNRRQIFESYLLIRCYDDNPA